MAVMAALIGRAERRPAASTSTCPSPRACCGSPRWPSTSTWPPGPRSVPGSNIITGRYACYDTYQAADGGWLAVGAIEPKFYANLCRLTRVRAVVGPPARRRGPGQDPGRLPGRVRHQGPRHLGGRAGRRRHLCHAGAVGGRAGRRRPVPGPSRLRRGGDRRRRRRQAGGDAPTRFRQVAPVLAGMPAPDGPVVVGDPLRSDTDRLLAAAGLSTRRTSPTCGNGGWWHERHRCRRHRPPDRRRAVRGGGGVPRRAGLRVDHVLVGGERQPALLGRAGGRAR